MMIPIMAMFDWLCCCARKGKTCWSGEGEVMPGSTLLPTAGLQKGRGKGGKKRELVQVWGNGFRKLRSVWTLRCLGSRSGDGKQSRLLLLLDRWDFYKQALSRSWTTTTPTKTPITTLLCRDDNGWSYSRLGQLQSATAVPPTHDNRCKGPRCRFLFRTHFRWAIVTNNRNWIFGSDAIAYTLLLGYLRLGAIYIDPGFSNNHHTAVPNGGLCENLFRRLNGLAERAESLRGDRLLPHDHPCQDDRQQRPDVVHLHQRHHWASQGRGAEALEVSVCCLRALHDDPAPRGRGALLPAAHVPHSCWSPRHRQRHVRQVFLSFSW